MQKKPYGEKTFTICADCRRRLIIKHKTTGKKIPWVSKYPYCAPCFLKRTHDPGFKSWLLRLHIADKI